MGMISISCVIFLVILRAKLIFIETSCHLIEHRIIYFAPKMYVLKFKYNLSVYLEI